jgi:phosphoribosylformimino-5-aminoimidazole carboxamide ribotide isomerase
MEVIPAVDILGGAVVRLMKGDYDEITDYGSDVLDAARRWLDDGAELVHIVDLDGARDGHPDVEVWTRLGEAGVPFQVGGGIRTVPAVEAAVRAGANRVILGTAAVWEPEVLEAAVAAVGSKAVVAAVDVRDGRAKGAGWLDAGRAMEEVVAGVLEAGVAQLLVTAVARDGTMSGPDVPLIDSVRSVAGEAVILSAGGIGTLDHIAMLRDAGVDGAVVGRALYENAFTLAEARAVAGSPR